MDPGWWEAAEPPEVELPEEPPSSQRFGLPARTARARLAILLEDLEAAGKTDAELEEVAVNYLPWLPEVDDPKAPRARDGAVAAGWCGRKGKLGAAGLLLALTVATGKSGKRIVCDVGEPRTRTKVTPVSMSNGVHYHLVRGLRVGGGLGAVEVSATDDAT